MTLPPLVAALTILSAASYMLADYQRKTLSTRAAPIVLVSIFAAVQAPFLLGWSLLSGWRMTEAYLWPGLVNLVVGLLGNYLFILSMRSSQFGVVVPVLSFVPIMASIFSAVGIGEIPSPTQWAGVVLATLGLVVMQSPADRGISISGGFAAWRRDRGALYMLAVAFLWAATAPLDKLCIQASSPSAHAFTQMAGLALLIAPLVLYIRTRSAKNANAPGLPGRGLLVCGVAGAVAYGAEMAAYSQAHVGLVECVKRTATMLLALLIGRFSFGEAITAAKMAGASLLIAALILVLYG